MLEDLFDDILMFYEILMILILKLIFPTGILGYYFDLNQRRKPNGVENETARH
jgi:hypothetical protein